MDDSSKKQAAFRLITGYGLAVFSTGLSAMVRWLVPWALAPAPYLGFYPAVVVSAALGGVGPGLFSTFASLVLVNFVFGRFNIHDTGSMARQVIWITASIGVSILAGMQRAARIREKQKAEELRVLNEELEESEKQFRTLADSIPNLAWWANGDGYITWYNQRWYDYTGTTPEQMEGWGWQSVHDPDMLPTVLERWKASISTGEPFDMEFPLRGNDGIFRPFLTRVMPVFNQEGKVARWFGTNTDISERKRSEDALRRSEEMYRSLFDNMLNGFAYCRMLFEEDQPADFIYLSVNAAFENLTGLRDVVGKKVSELIPGIRESDPGLFDIYGRVAVSGAPARFETYVEALGLWFFISVYSPAKGDFVAVFDVITERKQAEESLKASLHEKEVLLKEIHHRVKNNMQVISSLVSLQSDGSDDESVREVLKDVSYRVRSMAMVHEKLYQSVDLAHIDFAEYTRTLLSYLWRSHGAVAAAVRLTFDLDPISLSVDTAVPCGLILNELAGNALKHAFKGREKGEVTVSLKKNDDGHIRLSVADNGVGLPKDLDWRKTNSLGLRLVQMLARQLDADVNVSSAEGVMFEVCWRVS